VHTELVLSSAAAQYGHSAGIIQATAGRMITEFAANLRAQIAAQPS
jgi:hypothetical protein